MGDDKLSAVEHEVADQRIEEGEGTPGEANWLKFELGKGLRDAVRKLHIPALQFAHQLVLVVARHTQGGPGGDHAHDETQDAGARGAAVYEIAEEGGAPPFRVGCVESCSAIVVGRRTQDVAKLTEQQHELLEAPVDVSDDIERPGVVAPIGPHAVADEARGFYLLRRAEDVHVAKAFALQVAKGAAEVGYLAADNVRAELAFGAGLVAGVADLLLEVQHDGHGHDVVAAGELQQWPACLLLDVRRVDDSEASSFEPLRDEVVDERECIGCS